MQTLILDITSTTAIITTDHILHMVDLVTTTTPTTTDLQLDIMATDLVTIIITGNKFFSAFHLGI